MTEINPPAVPASDDDRVRHVRTLLPAVTERVYLNTGTAGPLPRMTAATIAAEVGRELMEGRAELAGFERLFGAMALLRAGFARVLGAGLDEIALTHHTSDGMNIACWGLNWQPGDELLTTTLEHEGGILPAYAAAQRFGADVRVVDLGMGAIPARVVETIERAIGPRTRLVSLSHVAWNSGVVLPLAAIAEAAHRRGALVLVDGAQGVGAIPVDVHALGVDFYAAPGQKWLCGPEGVGALYVRRDVLSLVRPTFTSYLSLRDFESWSLTGDFLLAPGARRFEVGTVFRPGVHAMIESLRFLDEEVGRPWAYARIERLAARARDVLGDLSGVHVITPPGQAGLVAFTVEGRAPEGVQRALAAQKFVIRTVPLAGESVLRISTGFYNTDEELFRLRGALAALPT